jgi:diguanylate cyclase (GGDEF)-like protein
LIGKPYGANLLADRQGRIWTQTGVYDPKADRLFELSAGDGADLGTGWFLSYAPTQDGRLLFGGSKGILVVSPDRFVETKFAAPLVVTDLRINGEHKDYGLPYRELVLEPSDRSFSIEFAALDFVNSSSLRYSYRLKGFADDWGATSANSRFASYSNLSPGTYTLQVRAANRSGDWSASELTIPVRKIAAWWQTTGFRLLGVAVALLLLFGLFRLRTKQLRVRQRELEAKVQERTEALELLNLELQQRSEALVQSSLIDPLTGLHNRRFLAQQIDADLALSQRALEAFGPAMAGPDWAGDLVFFLFDIDHFKRINDRHGHAVGDEVLIQFSQRIRAVFRDSDFLVRWGGEEFLGVARQTSRASAGELAERARMAIAGSAFEMQSGLSLRLTVSVGFAAYPLSIKHPRALMWEELVKLADAGLYLVKAHGRNGWAGVIDGGNLSADEIRDLVKRSLPEVLQLGQMGLECSAGVLAALNTARSEG